MTKYRNLLVILGAVLVWFGIIKQGWYLIVAWLGVDFVILGVAHGLGRPGVFGKRTDGTLPIWSWLLYCPMHLLSLGVWNAARLFGSEPATSVICADLIVGRRLIESEVPGEFQNFVDLTAEFQEPKSIRHAASYRCFPILDAAAPSPEALRMAAGALPPGKTYVHCAQGHGRTGLFALAVLLCRGDAESVDEGLQMLRAGRPGIQLNQVQRQCIEAYAKLLS